jgi:prepilin-type N-terminal cleavage/methylation domain-containing protein
MKKQKAFTLIEILLVIGIIVILAGGIIVALNPGRQFAKARDAQRVTDLNALLNAVVQNLTENQGRWNCTSSQYHSTTLPTNTTTIRATGTETDNTEINLSCLTSNNILSRIPVDPLRSPTDQISSYTIAAQEGGRITLCATGELNPNICISK